MFPTKEAGDYLNSNLVSIKYNLDKGDVDNIKETYGVKAFPTFIFVDGNGKEISRMLGGARDTKSFIARVSETIAKENSWDARNARFKSDPSYAMEHIAFLSSCYMEEEASKLLSELFAKRSIEENFNKASLAYYTENINDLNSPIIQYMLNNKKEVALITGEDTYNDFISSKTNRYIYSSAFGRGFNEANLNKALDLIGNNEELHTSYYKFMNSIKDVFVAKDFKTIIASANKYNKKSSSIDRSAMIQSVMMLASNKRQIDADKKDGIIALLNDAILYEKDEKAKQYYVRVVESI